MSNRQFITTENVNMLWEVINDEDIFKFLTRDIQEKIYQIFLNNVKGFFETERNKINNLVEMNKKYILIILNHIKVNYPYQPSKIKILNDPVIKEPITFEEIINERKVQFDNDFIRRQEEFQDFVTIKPPPIPEFADKNIDRPIKEMDKILKEMQLKRNYEIEEINKTQPKPVPSTSPTQTKNWLRSQELLPPQETLIKNQKTVSWDQNDQIFNVSENTVDSNKDKEDNNIFSKFKKINKVNDEEILPSEIVKSEQISIESEIVKSEQISIETEIVESEQISIETETIKSEQIKIESEPANFQPVKFELTNFEPVNFEPINFEQVKYDYNSVNFEPANSEPMPINSEPINSEPINSEPINSEPINFEPVKNEIIRPQQIKPETIRHEQKKLEMIRPQQIKPEMIRPQMKKPDLIKNEITNPKIVNPEIILIQTIYTKNKILELEQNIKSLNEKMDKIINFLFNK